MGFEFDEVWLSGMSPVPTPGDILSLLLFSKPVPQDANGSVVATVLWRRQATCWGSHLLVLDYPEVKWSRSPASVSFAWSLLRWLTLPLALTLASVLFSQARPGRGAARQGGGRHWRS